MSLIKESKLWRYKEIPWKATWKAEKKYGTEIDLAINDWNDNSVLKFIHLEEYLKTPGWGRRRRWASRNYLKFVYSKDDERCKSFVGMQNGVQKVTCGKNTSYQSIVHELGHAIGLHHEQQRNDRKIKKY